MRLHIDSKHFTKKPDGLAIGGIKRRLTDNSSIKDLTVPEIVSALIAGQTIQPGVTPFSNNSRMNGCKGTTDADFSEQTLFMIDLDNEQDDIPKEMIIPICGYRESGNLETANPAMWKLTVRR